MLKSQPIKIPNADFRLPIIGNSIIGGGDSNSTANDTEADAAGGKNSSFPKVRLHIVIIMQTSWFTGERSELYVLGLSNNT